MPCRSGCAYCSSSFDLKSTLSGVTSRISELIHSAIRTVQHKLIEEMIIVSIIILIFLWHVPSAIVPIITIPVSVALAFIPLYGIGQNANLMSLAGIAISIGVLVDGAIVEVENAYKKIEKWIEAGKPGSFYQVRLEALMEVGPSVFFSLLVVAVSFLPIFTLMDQEGRLFKPLAYSKNFAMGIAALLALTLDPAMRMLFARVEPFTFKPRWLAWTATQVVVGKYYAEEKHPISVFLHRIYERPCRFVVRHAKATIAVALLLVAGAFYWRLHVERGQSYIFMAFLIGAACGKQVGFSHQKIEMVSIAAGAFGWRAMSSP